SSLGPTVVLTSPWPESLYGFAPMWASLAEHARPFATDLPGFGASERRDDRLSPRAMGEFLAQLIVEADLGTPHIVAPRPPRSARQRGVPRRAAAYQPPRGRRGRPLCLGGVADRIRLDHPRLDHGQPIMAPPTPAPGDLLAVSLPRRRLGCLPSAQQP